MNPSTKGVPMPMLPLVLEVEDLDSGESDTYSFTQSPVRLGRQALNDLTLDFPFVSQWHGVLRVDSHGVHYLDLGSTNGSSVDGKPVGMGQETLLQSNSEILIGGRLRIRPSIGPNSPPVREEIYESKFYKVLRPDSTTTDSPSSVNRPAAPGGRSKTAPPPAVPPRGRPIAPRPLQRPQLGRSRVPVRPVSQPIAQPTPPPSVNERVSSPGDASMISEFAQAYIPQATPPTTAADQERFLNRMGVILETFSQTLLELRKGHETFGKDVGVSNLHGDSPLYTATKADEILAYLLNWNTPDNEQRQDVLRMFAGFMVHQVALLSGINAGMRALLSQLSPESIEKEATGAIGPLRAMSCWRLFCERYQELTEEDKSLSEALLGKDFAQAYATAAGTAPSNEQ